MFQSIHYVTSLPLYHFRELLGSTKLIRKMLNYTDRKGNVFKKADKEMTGWDLRVRRLKLLHRILFSISLRSISTSSKN